jgi:hypothetical protein
MEFWEVLLMMATTAATQIKPHVVWKVCMSWVDAGWGTALSVIAAICAIPLIIAWRKLKD